MKNKQVSLWGILAAAVALVALAGCGGPGNAPAKKPPLVTVTTALTGPLAQRLEATGEVVSVHEAVISATVEGPISFCPWREGDRVAAGQKLIEIDRALYRSDVASARAALEVARAKLADLAAGSRPEDIARAHADVEQLEECAEFARTDLERTQHLVETGALPRETAEKAGVAFTTCRTKLASARARLAMIEEGATATEIAVQEALVAEAAARYSGALAKLRECTLVAPFDAIITGVLVREGDVAASRAPLVELMADGALLVRFSVPEAQAPAVQPQSAVAVALDAYPGREFSAQITRVYPQLDSATRTRTAEAALDNPPELMPGMFARVVVTVREDTNAIIVPRTAVLSSAQGKTIAYVVSDGQAELREVTTGIEENGQVQIVSGIQAGEQVVIAGNEHLHNGSAVRLPAPSPATPSGADAPPEGRQ